MRVKGRKPKERKPPVWSRLSAGLITGAADDDPSGIATYSQVGAAYGYGTLWSVVAALPLMIGIQSVCARIGRVTGGGVGANIRAHYGRALGYALVLALVIANVINLGADIGAMGAALKLLVGGPALAYVGAFALLSTALQVYVPFSYYSPMLKVLTLSLFAYVATVFVIRVPWSQVWSSSLLPPGGFDGRYAVAIVAVFGTTISPYLFFWQASQEVEEVNDPGNARKPLRRKPSQGKDALQRIRIDTVSGMLISELVAFFIIVTAAVVLHAHGKTDINTSAQAAAALRPLAGRFASALFAAGIVGTGLLAVPILAGSAAFGTAEAFGKPCSLARKPGQAKLFYGTLVVASALGLALNFTPINPIKALYWSAVINGVAAVPIMIVIMLLGANRRIMGQFVLPWGLKILGWAATVVMAAAAVVMFVTWGR
ncbi:MAG TPA: divalent metal cation transporter [Steroidobacteraceae bacterium]|nr:divalent metal cation transporter [Steroidobacteraceae bacterium]